MDRPIRCGMCQKELDPARDAVTFMGVGKMLEGPGLFHALCATKTPTGEESACVKSGVAWATQALYQNPVFLTYEEWRARPVRRTVQVTKSAKGRYDLQLTEFHLNTFYFLDHASSKKPEKVKQILEEWKGRWNIPAEDIPDIDKMEEEARTPKPQKPASLLDMLKDRHEARKSGKTELPAELLAELERHRKVHVEHLLKNVETNGDDCESCRISRGIEKLYIQGEWVPLLAASLENLESVMKTPGLSYLVSQCKDHYKQIEKVVCERLGFKPHDGKHNEEAARRNMEDMKLATALVERHHLRKPPTPQPEATGQPRVEKKTTGGRRRKSKQ